MHTAIVEVIHAWTVPGIGADPLTWQSRICELAALAPRNHLVDSADERGARRPIERRLRPPDRRMPASTRQEAADPLVVGCRGLRLSRRSSLGKPAGLRSRAVRGEGDDGAMNGVAGLGNPGDLLEVAALEC